MSKVRVDGRIQLKRVRVSFFHGFEPQAFEGSKPAYTMHLLLEEGHPQRKELEAVLQRVAKATWGANAAAVYKQLKTQDRLCLRDGSTKLTSEGEIMEGYDGAVYLSARSYKRPTIIDRDRTPLTADDGRPYSGCYVNAIVEIWAQAGGQYGKRINCQIQGVQFVEDGESFGGGGRTASADEFESLADEFDGDDSFGDDGDSFDDDLAG